MSYFCNCVKCGRRIEYDDYRVRPYNDFDGWVCYDCEQDMNPNYPTISNAIRCSSV